MNIKKIINTAVTILLCVAIDISLGWLCYFFSEKGISITPTYGLANIAVLGLYTVAFFVFFMATVLFSVAAVFMIPGELEVIWA